MTRPAPAPLVAAPPDLARFAISAGFLALAFLLPPQVGPELYGLILIAAAGLLMAVEAIRGERLITPPSYFLFLAIFAFFYVASAIPAWLVPGHFYSRAAVTPQAAGLMVLAATMPAFALACRHVLLPRPNLPALLAITALALLVAATLRAQENMFLGGTIYGALAPTLLLQFVLFLAAQRVTGNALLRALMMLALIPLMGASTNILIQLALAVVFLLGGHRGAVLAIATAVVAMVWLITFPPESVGSFLAGDANAILRSRTFQATLADIAARPWGQGFGFSYASFDAMRDPYVYNLYSYNPLRSLEVPNHSSLLDTPLRLGIPGLIVVLAMFWPTWRRVERSDLAVPVSGLLAILLITAAFNPGLESARTAIFFAFGAGYIWAASMRVEKPAQPVTPAPWFTSLSPAERRARLASQARAA